MIPTIRDYERALSRIQHLKGVVSFQRYKRSRERKIKDRAKYLLIFVVLLELATVFYFMVIYV